MQLRPYQERASEAVMNAKREGLGRVLMVMPTGCGKTISFTDVIGKVQEEDPRPALVLAHREELLSQAQRTVEAMLPGAWCSAEMGDRRADERANVILGSVPTLSRSGSKRLDWLCQQGASIVIMDECHHCASAGYGRVAERFGCMEGRTFLLGCTATPKRLDRKELVGDSGEVMFQKEVFSYPLIAAIKEGYLCPVRGYRVVTDTDLSGVSTLAGDFNVAALARAVDTENRTRKAVEHWREIAGDRKTLVFCASVEHAAHAAAEWAKAGVRAAYASGEMPLEQRRDALRRFRAGETQVLCNCGLFTEGFDEPSINCIVQLRPTQSWALYAQMVGRGTRLSPETGKTDCLIIDVCDNTTRHELASCPTLIGLPAGMDMEGHTLEEAHDEWEEAAAEGGVSKGNPPARFSEIKTKLLEVKLLKDEAGLPPEVEENSRLAWLWVGTGGYLLQGGSYVGGHPRVARCEMDALGAWHLVVGLHTPGRVHRVEVGQGDLPDFSVMDEVIERLWPDALNLVRREARWKTDKITDGQIRFLQRYIKDKEYLMGLTKGQASNLIMRRKMAKGGGR